MPSFLFWNVNNREVSTTLGQLVSEHPVDVLILAECAMSVAEVLLTLNPTTTADTVFSFSSSPDPSERIKIFTKFGSSCLVPFGDGKHHTARRVKFPSADELLLFAVHLPSRLMEDKIDLDEYARDVAAEVLQQESTASHSRTIVVGDFNMNPFSRGMISAAAFNAVSLKRIAKQGERNFKGRTRKYFYNPMWAFFHEEEARSPGTYFHDAPSYESIHWNIFDQVILRPELIDYLEPGSLKIISKCKDKPLTKGVNQRPSPSDHLPIVFSLKNSL